jgi:hypothetical protein
MSERCKAYLRHADTQKGLHVRSNIWIAVLIDCDRSGRMLAKNIAEPNFIFGQVRLDGCKHLRCKTHVCMLYEWALFCICMRAYVRECVGLE